MTTKIQIKSRFSGAVLFETEIAAEFADRNYGFRLGLAVRAAYKSGANLSGADLSDAYLSGLDLRGSDLRDSNLRDSILRGADLSGLDLRGSDLRGADLRGSNLSGSNLSGSNLRGSNLSGSNLRDSNLSGRKIVRILARVARLDGYEFIAFETDKGVIIRAGCRTMSPAEYRDHAAREYPDTDKAEETLSILDFIEARAARLCKVECR